MLGFVARRLVLTIPLVFVIVTATFALLRLAPGSPLARERAMPPEIRAHLERFYGLDRPWYEQYINYLRGVIRGDLGPSYRYRDVTVNEIISRGLPVSARLGVLAYGIALLVGIPCGILAAVRASSWMAHLPLALAVLALSIPNFVLGPLLVLVFALTWYWLPPAGWGEWRHYVLPVITLSSGYIGIIARLTRNGLREILSQEYIRAAYAKGVPESEIILTHALRPALVPVLSFTGPSLAFLVTGTVVVEQIFALPGLGSFFVQAAFHRDYTVVLGVVLFISLVLILLNLLVDVAYALLDPRISFTERRRR